MDHPSAYDPYAAGTEYHLSHVPQPQQHYGQYGFYSQQYYPTAAGLPSQPTHRNLSKRGCTLRIRQSPQDALATTTGKEKARKPLDPPPVVELTVEDEIDPVGLYRNSPNLFCTAHLCSPDSTDPHVTADNEPAMVGTLCSSVHRLKDESGTEKAFFVFGDVSIREPGTWRLRFTLHDIPFGQLDDMRCVQLCSVYTSSFSVLQGKDFKGLAESTELTRKFSDQGVRLRLRKEQRSTKRKMEDRSPSAEPVPNELHDIEKRPRFDDFPESTEFSAGPVQPHQDTSFIASDHLPFTESLGYPAGQVQPTTSNAPTYQTYLGSHQRIPSRYDERLGNEMVNLNQGGSWTGPNAYQYGFPNDSLDFRAPP